MLSGVVAADNGRPHSSGVVKSERVCGAVPYGEVVFFLFGLQGLRGRPFERARNIEGLIPSADESKKVDSRRFFVFSPTLLTLKSSLILATS